MTFTACLLVFLSLIAQPGVIAPIDIRGNRLEEAKGTSWRVFAVGTDPDGPLATGRKADIAALIRAVADRLPVP